MPSNPFSAKSGFSPSTLEKGQVRSSCQIRSKLLTRVVEERSIFFDMFCFCVLLLNNLIVKTAVDIMSESMERICACSLFLSM